MDPIVPERGERIGKRATAERVPSSANTRQTPKPQKSDQPPVSGSGLFLKVGLVLALLACIGLGLMAFNQSKSLAELRQQFDDLQSKIDTTDESLNQSGAALSLKLSEHTKALAAHDTKLKEHFSEIDKLWAARNQNKKKAEQSVTAVKGLQAKLDKLGSANTAINKTIEKTKKDLSGLKTQLIVAQSERAEMADDLAAMLKQLDMFENSIKQWQAKTNARISDTEEAVKAIDAFRHSVNQKLQSLRSPSAG